MQPQSENKHLWCPVCKSKFNKVDRLPIFMMCCRQTACENCVYTKMCASLRTLSGVIPDGKFQCLLCQSQKYAPKGVDKNLPMFYNDLALGMIESQEDHLPIFCDGYPQEPAIWYSTSAKTLISNQQFLKKADLIPSCIPINKQNLDNFFADAKQQLTDFKDSIIALIDRLSTYLNTSVSNMKSSEFLGFIGKVKQLCEIQAAFKEERKEQQDFDWLFKGQYESTSNQKNVQELDTKVINMKKEWAMIESWFDGKKIKLEKLYRATEDGFTGEKFHAKCNN